MLHDEDEGEGEGAADDDDDDTELQRKKKIDKGAYHVELKKKWRFGNPLLRC